MSRSTHSPWPRRTAFALVYLTLPLLLLGGTVTTLRVGMAVPDWPTTFGENMFTYSLKEMLKNSGVSWEHTHRLYASFIGLCTIALAAAHIAFEKRALVRNLALTALVLVIVQGVLGGLRVLENSPQLAFVHGSLAQAFFGLAGAIAVMQSRAWSQARSEPCKRVVALRRVGLAAVALVYAQIVLGAWLRHSGNMVALALHVVLAALATGALIALARELRLTAEAGAQGGHDRSVLLRVRRNLILALSAQLILGVLAAVWVYLVTGPHRPVSVGEAVFATAHVGVGALLLWAVLAASMWSYRIVSNPSVAQAAERGLEGAR
ncbi:MAG: COX15/CtaA family protein [Planctomycetes bacterium]|nr:COX15/CtaA family protein [Planctomycetota bacterium]